MSSENCLYLDVWIDGDKMCPEGDLEGQGSGEWQRCRTAGFNGLAQVWDGRVQRNGRAQENDAGTVEWQDSTGWRRCRTAGFDGLTQV